MNPRPLLDNGDLPRAKNKLRRKDDYVELLLNSSNPNQPEHWIKIDESSIGKLAKHSWFCPKSGYVSTLIKSKTISMHRMLLEVLDRPEVILEFAGEDRSDYRLSNIRTRSIGNLQRIFEKKQEQLTVSLVKTASDLMDASVRKEVSQVALSQAANMLAIIISIANDPKAKNSDRLNAANAILNRAIGKDDSDVISPNQLPSIQITFANPPNPVIEVGEIQDVNVIDIPTPIFQ